MTNNRLVRVGDHLLQLRRHLLYTLAADTHNMRFKRHGIPGINTIVQYVPDRIIAPGGASFIFSPNIGKVYGWCRYRCDVQPLRNIGYGNPLCSPFKYLPDNLRSRLVNYNRMAHLSFL